MFVNLREVKLYYHSLWYHRAWLCCVIANRECCVWLYHFHKYNKFTSHRVTYKSPHTQRLISQGIFLDLTESETLPNLETFWFMSKDGSYLSL